MAIPSWIPSDLAARVRSSSFLRFLVAGGINTALCFAIYAVQVRAGFDVSVANFMAWIIGVVFSFYLNCRFVFHRAFQVRLLSVFFLSNLGALVLSTILLAALVHSLGVDKIWAWLITVPLVVIANFLINRYFIFAR